MAPTRPLVLVFGGLDPSGAGLQADIETCFALGCHPLPIATSLTVQNTAEVRDVGLIDPGLVSAQVSHLLSDTSMISACKIGMLPTAAMVNAVATLVRPFVGIIPIILDPVFTASSGGYLADASVRDVLLERLLPLATLVKPNHAEARKLTGEGDIIRAGALIAQQARNCVLLTGTDAGDPTHVHHYLFRPNVLHTEYRWPRFEGCFHGTGCTLTSAIASFAARGYTLDCAVGAALTYTWHAVQEAHSIGGKQAIPGRRLNRELR
jgi:hydroxymethylpyrimidine/phosphomethylpyrimidine kinase